MQTCDFIQESAQRVEQQRRRQLMKDRRDKKASDARDTRQYIKIGKLVCQYFPSLLNCQPSTNNIESDELGFFESILKMHSDTPDLLRQLRDIYDRRKL